jgi:HSP90 family molecular chaperone
MKLDQDPRTFESNTANSKSAFTIAASSKAFQILSNQLYTDKPRAILRELSTNALDAHIAAGKADVPFEVQLPTTWDSTLIVKDFGTGMSPEAIKSLA